MLTDDESVLRPGYSVEGRGNPLGSLPLVEFVAPDRRKVDSLYAAKLLDHRRENADNSNSDTDDYNDCTDTFVNHSSRIAAHARAFNSVSQMPDLTRARKS